MKDEPRSFTTPSGIVIEKDVDVPMRDGARLKADVFRPDDGGKFPAHLESRAVPEGQALGAAGQRWRKKPNPLMNWETVNPRMVGAAGATPPCGSTAAAAANPPASASRGRLPKSIDFYDAIEWAAAQPWCYGKVGLSGISYFAINQWFVANHQPPSLKAIIPWEGFADLYRDALFHGGPAQPVHAQLVSSAHLMHHVVGRASRASSRTRWQTNTLHFWLQQQSRQRRACAARRRSGTRSPCRCFSVGNWSGMALHLRGNTEAFMRAADARTRSFASRPARTCTRSIPRRGGAISCASSTTGSRASTTA